MNKYVFPICNLIHIHNKFSKVYYARSIVDCQDKIMREYSEIYDEDFTDYKEFQDIMDKKYNYSIGEVVDIETL